jgi:hypothetical protein
MNLLAPVKIVKDFLPSPQELAEHEKTTKEHHIPYQKMIRRLLDEYREQHS